MSVRVIVGTEDGGQSVALLYDSTTGVPLSLEVFPDEGEWYAGGLAVEFEKAALDELGIQDLRHVAPATLYTYQRRWFHERKATANDG